MNKILRAMNVGRLALRKVFFIKKGEIKSKNSLNLKIYNELMCTHVSKHRGGFLKLKYKQNKIKANKINKSINYKKKYVCVMRENIFINIIVATEAI